MAPQTANSWTSLSRVLRQEGPGRSKALVSSTRDEPISRSPSPIRRDKLFTYTRSQVKVCEQAATFWRSNTRTATKRSTPSAVFSEYLMSSKTVLPLSQHTDPSPKRTRGLHLQDTSRASVTNFTTSASQAATPSLDNVCRNNEARSETYGIGDPCHDLHKPSCRPCRALCAHLRRGTATSPHHRRCGPSQL